MSLKDLMEKLDDYDIYSYYLGNFQIGKVMNSPLRTDKVPSFAVFRSGTGALLFKDHGSGDSGNALQFIKLYKNITDRVELEKELLRIIRKTNPQKLDRKVTYTPTQTYETDIGIVRQPFTEVDKRYWKQFHISIDTLKKFNVLVFPGFAETFAKALRFNMVLIKLDFPTFDLPTNTI